MSRRDEQRKGKHMKIENITIRNFRRLENVSIDIEDRETVFVGPNNSGKTSATAIFRCFLGEKEFRIHDFSVTKIVGLNEFGQTGEPQNLASIELDIWFSIDPNGIAFGRAFSLLPRLSAEFDRVGVRLSFGAGDSAKMLAEYHNAYPTLPDDRTFTIHGLRSKAALPCAHHSYNRFSLFKPIVKPSAS